MQIDFLNTDYDVNHSLCLTSSLSLQTQLKIRYSAFDNHQGLKIKTPNRFWTNFLMTALPAVIKKLELLKKSRKF